MEEGHRVVDLVTGKLWEECEECGALTQVLSGDPDAALVCEVCSWDGSGYEELSEEELEQRTWTDHRGRP